MGSTGKLCKKVGFELALKGIGGGESLMSRGKPFQIVGQGKDLLPNSLENRAQAKRSWLVERRVQLGCSSELKYGGNWDNW